MTVGWFDPVRSGFCLQEEKVPVAYPTGRKIAAQRWLPRAKANFVPVVPEHGRLLSKAQQRVQFFRGRSSLLLSALRVAPLSVFYAFRLRYQPLLILLEKERRFRYNFSHENKSQTIDPHLPNCIVTYDVSPKDRGHRELQKDNPDLQ